MKPKTSVTFWPNRKELIDDDAMDVLVHELKDTIDVFIAQERLDKQFSSYIKSVYIPLAAWIAKKHTHKPIVIGVNGAQGSGKSTLSKLLAIILTKGFGKSTLNLSIDDLYLSRLERKYLAEQQHPLFMVRGVPGTHNVKLAEQILSSLVNKTDSNSVVVPVFDKAQDDLLPQSQWCKIENPVDIILFEGWCVGARAEEGDALSTSINELERTEDPDGIWRSYVNEQLQGPYKQLFSRLDYLLMLKVPDMESVYEWRKLQEEKLRLNNTASSGIASRIMSAEQVPRFIMFYERITRHCLAEMPQRADVVFKLDKQHQVSHIELNI